MLERMLRIFLRTKNHGIWPANMTRGQDFMLFLRATWICRFSSFCFSRLQLLPTAWCSDGAPVRRFLQRPQNGSSLVQSWWTTLGWDYGFDVLRIGPVCVLIFVNAVTDFSCVMHFVFRKRKFQFQKLESNFHRMKELPSCRPWENLIYQTGTFFFFRMLLPWQGTGQISSQWSPKMQVVTLTWRVLWKFLNLIPATVRHQGEGIEDVSTLSRQRAIHQADSLHPNHCLSNFFQQHLKHLFLVFIQIKCLGRNMSPVRARPTEKAGEKTIYRYTWSNWAPSYGRWKLPKLRWKVSCQHHLTCPSQILSWWLLKMLVVGIFESHLLRCFVLRKSGKFPTHFANALPGC